MRLIDADELIKDDEINLWLSNDAVRTGKTLKMFSELFIKKIDEQPTIQAVPIDVLDKIRAEIIDTGAYEQETNGKTQFLKGIDYCLSVIDEALEQEPRKGEWLRMSDLSEQEDDRYKCSRCGNVIHHKNKMDLYTFNSWCGRCGSDNGRHKRIEANLL